MSDELQERLVNWGYAFSDAALRTHVDDEIAVPTQFPYPERRVYGFAVDRLQGKEGRRCQAHR
jgi:hypothetical protein